MNLPAEFADGFLSRLSVEEVVNIVCIMPLHSADGVRIVSSYFKTRITIGSLFAIRGIGRRGFGRRRCDNATIASGPGWHECSSVQGSELKTFTLYLHIEIFPKVASCIRREREHER
jgi:hypothetical protein